MIPFISEDLFAQDTHTWR